MSTIEPLVPSRSISARIAEQILARIQSGEFPVGTKLPPELELARRFGVSRPSVREALGALQFVGYLASVRGSGNRVISASPSGGLAGPEPREVTDGALPDLFAARLRIEPLVAADAAADPDVERLEGLASLIDGMRLAVDEPTLHADTDLRVHRAFAGVCRNPFLRRSALELLAVMASAALRPTREGAWRDPALPAVWAGQHDQVLAAMTAGDAAAAADATWHHVASAAANALDVLGPDALTDAPAERLRSLLGQGPPAARRTRRTGRRRQPSGPGAGAR